MHPWGGLVVVAILSAVLLIVWLIISSGSVETSVEQVPSDIKNIKLINEELRNQGLEPIEF
mgnify:FL=1